MRKIIVLLGAVATLFSFIGCGQTVCDGGQLLFYGMIFDSQIEMLQESFSIDLDDLTDNDIKRIFSEIDENGNSLKIEYINLEGAEEEIASKLDNSEHWTALPFDSEISEILSLNNIEEHYAFSKIPKGLYTISGVEKNGKAFDFDRRNIEMWQNTNIGIWDTNDETLYFISIIKQ